MRRSDRRAQGHRPTLRSIRPKRSTQRPDASVDPTEARKAKSCRARGVSEGLDEVPELRDRGILLGVEVPRLSVQRLNAPAAGVAVRRPAPVEPDAGV